MFAIQLGLHSHFDEKQMKNFKTSAVFCKITINSIE